MIFATPIKLESITTERVLIRPARVTDAKLMHDAMKDSYKVLKKWMPWAQSLASLRDTIAYLEDGERLWSSAPKDTVELPLQIMDAKDKIYLGATGIKPENLTVPCFEIGYWVNQKHSGKGFISEAMNALTRYLFKAHHAKRVEINCEEANIKSAKVVERINFQFEANLKNKRLTADSRNVTNSLIYACADMNDLPPLEWSYKHEDE
tara:strand:+ start:106230 stop:106850 length:621 start_codon:yes stop_codon:yes gene_type:complete